MRLDLPRTSRVTELTDGASRITCGTSSFSVRGASVVVGHTTVPLGTWIKQPSAPGHCARLKSISTCITDQTHAVPRTLSRSEVLDIKFG